MGKKRKTMQSMFSREITPLINKKVEGTEDRKEILDSFKEVSWDTPIESLINQSLVNLSLSTHSTLKPNRNLCYLR